MKSTRHPWRTVGVILAATAGVLGAMVSPASASGSGSLTSGATNPGLETHVGVPTATPFDVPCAIFTRYNYSVAFPADSAGVTVGGNTYKHVHAHVYSDAAKTWEEGPEGTFAGTPLGSVPNSTGIGPDPVPAGGIPAVDASACTSPTHGGQAISGFNLVLTGVDDALPAHSLSCTGTGTYSRTNQSNLDGDGTKVNYTFTNANCGANTASFSFDVLIAQGPQPGLPPFFWTTQCTGPIAPAGCLSQGTVTVS